MASAQAQHVKQEAKNQLMDSRKAELSRLQALKEINPAIRDEEIHHLELQLQESLAAIETSEVSLDALRLIVVTQG